MMRRLLLEGLESAFREDTLCLQWVNEDFFKLKLAMWLEQKGYKVYPERNTKDDIKSDQQSQRNSKKELDLFLIFKNKKIGVELSCALESNKGVTNSVLKIWKDIAYLELLKKNKVIRNGYFLMLTDNKLFWSRSNDSRWVSESNREAYRCLRETKKLCKEMDGIILNSKYRIEWIRLSHSPNFQCFIIAV